MGQNTRKAAGCAVSGRGAVLGWRIMAVGGTEEFSMRRADKEHTDPKDLDEVLDAVTWGTLGLAGADGFPTLVPVNYVRVGENIVFHGATAGEKMELLAACGDATFLVVEPYAFIPSYASDPVRACPCTQFFKSVLLYGKVAQVEDPARKAELLQALMRKLQPEGGHTPITAPDPMYRASLAGVAVLELTVARRSGKFAFGQTFPEARRASVEALLATRGGPMDRETLEAMGRFKN